MTELEHPMKPCNVVSYVRVSTQRQGQSGLGLDAQRSAVAAYCAEHRYEVAREFREVESGRKNDRRVLREAIAYAKRTKSVLLIAKLDRLARNVAFIANLMESGVQFRACDLPEANPLLLHVMAAIAEHEASAISQRTRAALAEAKKRGTLLGASNSKCRNLTRDHAARGARATSAKASVAYAGVAPVIRQLRDQGHSLAKIAQHLDAEGHTTRAGSTWSAVQVKRVLDRTVFA